MIQGKSEALRVLILSRDDLRDTTPPISWGLLKRSPFYTWRCQRLFGTDLPFCASHNQGPGNIDKMGKRVKREKEMPAGIFFRFFACEKGYQSNVFCQACLSGLISALTTFLPFWSLIISDWAPVTFAICPKGRFDINLAKEL
jgi:hypothetical protein